MANAAFDLETDVLVVGSGPSGGALALALARFGGIRTVVVNRFGWTCRTPRAHITNPPALQVLRDLGVMEEVDRYAISNKLMAENVICRSLAGEEYGRLRTWGNEPLRRYNYETGTPETTVDLPQNYLENILISAAAHKGTDVLFNTEFVSFEQDEDGVTSLVESRLTGQRMTIRSKYLIGADGARSAVAAQLGLPFEGRMDKNGASNIVFEADLAKYTEHRPSSLYRIMRPAPIPGGIASGVLRMVRPWSRWVAITFFDVNNPPEIDDEAAKRIVHDLIGDPAVDVQIKSVSLWSFNEAWATTFHKGRVFCAGDAVHRHPPLKGLGSNTSIQDSYNLAWKLALVLKGQAAPSLLDTYSTERVPVAAEFVPAAYGAARYYGDVSKALNPSQSQDVEVVSESIRALQDPTEEAAGRRATLQAAIANTYRTYDCPGIEMNQRYESAAIVAPPGETSPAFEQDRELYYQPTSFPGARLPHAWLFKDERKVSSLYVCGDSQFTLLTGMAGAGWAPIAEEIAAEFGIPIRTVQIGQGGDYQDLYGDYARVREVAESGVLLVRPDLYVGWRAMSFTPTAGQDLRAALAALLGRT